METELETGLGTDSAGVAAMQSAVTGNSGLDTISLVIGVIFVIVYSYERFNNPVSNRSSTTAVRYHLAALSYTVAYLIIFFILSRYTLLTDPLISSLSPEATTQFNQLPPALVVALLLTGFLQKIPILSYIDKRLRAYLQYLAAIPFEVRRLAKQLRSAEFLVDKETQNKVYKWLRDDGLTCDDIKFEDRNESYWLWNKASVLMYHLSKWEEQRKTSSYMAAKAKEYVLIKKQYYRLSEMAKSYSSICNRSELAAEENPAIAELVKTFQEQCRNLIISQCEFISHGALKCLLTNQARIALLRDMGFQLPDNDEDAGLTVNQMATLLIALFGGMLTVMILSGGSFGGNSRRLIILTLIATMNMVAVATVVYTKGIWSISIPDQNGSRPVFYYLLVALAAVVVSIPVTLFFNIIIGVAVNGKGWGVALAGSWMGFISSSYPWKLMIFTTTLCLAFQLDTKQMGNITYPNMRWVEGLIQAGVALAAAYMTYQWLLGVDETRWSNVPLDKVLIRSTIIGFLIGYLIPYWYKTSPKKLQNGLHKDEEYIAGKHEAVIQKA